MGRRQRFGFSVVELLVVTGVIGILVGLLLPAVQQVRASAARISCLNNLKQIGISLHHFHDAHGRFPPFAAPSGATGDPNRCLGWMALILPYIEQEALYQASVRACAEDPQPLHNPPHVGLATVIPPYVCPADGRLLEPHTDKYFQIRASFTSYIGNGGAASKTLNQGFAGVFGDQPGCRLSQITDGTSQTLMVSERPPPDTFQAGWWYPASLYFGGWGGPNHLMVFGVITVLDFDRCPISRAFGPGRTDNPCDRHHLWSLHPGGANFLFADASARFLPYSAEALVIPLATRNGGETVELP